MADGPTDAETKQIAEAYWGTGPQRFQVRDAHGLGEPPRILTESMRRYIASASPSLFGLWVTCSVLFTLTHVVTVAATHNVLFPPIAPLLFIGLAIVSGRTRAQNHGRIRRVITDGALVSAVVRNIHQVQTRRYVTTTVSYRVDGQDRDAFVVSREQAVTFLQVGLRDEVLWLADVPDVVVPTFLVA